MFYSENNLKFTDNKLGSLDEVRILDKNGRLVKTIIAKRLEEFSDYKKHSEILNKKRMFKKVKASDLIEIEK